MNALVVMDQKFGIDDSGCVYTKTMFGPEFWQNYLNVFDKVKVISRLYPIGDQQEDLIRIDSDVVSFHRVPYYEGPNQFLKNYRNIRRETLKAVEPGVPTILRLPQNLPIMVGNYMARRNLPFAIELTGCPWDVLSPGATKSFFRPVYRLLSTRFTKKLCHRAAAASYVTASALQKRYPPGPGKIATHYSSIVLEKVAQHSRDEESFSNRPLKLITVGSMNQLYKAQDILIEATSILLKNGVDVRLTLVGDGQHRDSLTQLANQFGISENVEFLGHVTMGDEVVKQLDNADLFVLPSRQEGLPRAMIEAMARSLPCIGSNVGGISELVPDWVVEPNDPKALAARIQELVASPAEMVNQSAINLETSKDYLSSVLVERRTKFYEQYKAIVANDR